jgi:nicotinamide riboside kinase
VPWVSDPQRDRPHLREHMHALFVGELESLGARFVTIRGTWQERFEAAAAAVNGIEGP